MSLVVKNHLPMQWILEIIIDTLGQEDFLEEGKATDSSIPVWRIPMDRGAWQATGHWVTESLTLLGQLNTHTVKTLEGRSPT